MRAMVLKSLGALEDNPAPLELAEWPNPAPKTGEILIRVSVCGVCHTELDEIEGRTPPPKLPVIPGHQIVGRVEALGMNVLEFKKGDRVGAAWIWSACGICEFCRSGQENLCGDFIATGRDAHGGYAEFMTVPAAFVFHIPEVFSDASCAIALRRSCWIPGFTPYKHSERPKSWIYRLWRFRASGSAIGQASLSGYKNICLRP